MAIRLGRILVERGVLDDQQVQRILQEQKQTGEPFGLICERLCKVSPQTIESAWAEQYAGLVQEVDLSIEHFEAKALALVTRRQAWQFRALPIRFTETELMMASTQLHLSRALRFATHVIGVPVFFVLADPENLGQALCRHYPLPGLTPESVSVNSMDRYLVLANGSGTREH